MFSPKPIKGKIICPSSGDVEIQIKKKTPSKFQVLPPCKLEVEGQSYVPKTYSQEFALDTYPDPERELNLAAAQVLNGIEHLLNKRQSTKSVSQLYSEMIENGYNETNVEEYLLTDPLQEAYEEVTQTLTPHLPLWLAVLSGTFLTLTILALICTMCDSYHKRKAKLERISNRERFLQASRLRNMDTDNPQFVNLMRLL